MQDKGKQATSEPQELDVGTCPACGRTSVLYQAHLQAYDRGPTLDPIPISNRRVVVLLCPECRANSNQLGIMLEEDLFIVSHHSHWAKAEVIRVS